jgi:hypothetical protein
MNMGRVYPQVLLLAALPQDKYCQAQTIKRKTTIWTCMFLISLLTRDKTESNRLHGPGIEVHVSTTTLPHDLTRPVTCSFWTLPRALISHHSPFLEAACSRDFKERRENRIELPEDDPTVFGLFVEWMYYGDYAIAPLSSFPAGSTKSTNVNAKCWVLGDKLLCTDFKNHAMSRLYAQHTAVAFNRAVTTSDVQYACNNSANPSKLRELYVALVAMHFDSPDRTGGTAEEWDSLVVEHSDLRSSLLQSFRSNAKDRTFLKSKEHYLERSPISARIGPDQ